MHLSAGDPTRVTCEVCRCTIQRARVKAHLKTAKHNKAVEARRQHCCTEDCDEYCEDYDSDPYAEDPYLYEEWLKTRKA